MSSIRVYELARELGVGSRDVLERAQTLDIDVTSALSGLEPGAADTIRGVVDEDRPIRLRVHELARELGLSSRDILERAEMLEIIVASALSTVDEIEASQIRNFGGSGRERAAVAPWSPLSATAATDAVDDSDADDAVIEAEPAAEPGGAVAVLVDVPVPIETNGVVEADDAERELPPLPPADPDLIGTERPDDQDLVAGGEESAIVEADEDETEVRAAVAAVAAAWDAYGTGADAPTDAGAVVDEGTREAAVQSRGDRVKGLVGALRVWTLAQRLWRDPKEIYWWLGPWAFLLPVPVVPVALISVGRYRWHLAIQGAAVLVVAMVGIVAIPALGIWGALLSLLAGGFMRFVTAAVVLGFVFRDTPWPSPAGMTLDRE